MNFKQEDLENYCECERLGILPNLEVFLEENIVIIHKGFLKLIKKMEKEKKNEQQESFLKNIDYEDFIELSKKKFAIELKKEQERIYKSDVLKLQLNVKELSKKMKNYTQNPEYQRKLKKVIKSISKDFIEEYRKIL